jgi:16S rRNA C967 or C1407 C5-methylase (RsmB/RsmF family)/NOL1/NOP2/fmu family ribosome biogenesis protein
VKALPHVLLQELETVSGFNEESFIAAHQQPAVTSVRLHPVKSSDAFANARQVPWCKEGRYLEERPVFTLDPLYHAGAYYVQEASSMFLHYLMRKLIPERKNLRVLDLCAAPGGKSTLLASLLDETSLLISNEVIRTRASILEENVTRWGYTNNWVCSNDPKEFGRLEGYFDLMVVDAPCSGSGLFRKDQKALDEWTEANVQLCCERQHRIIADVWPALKEDGILVYATCSYSHQEDEDVLDWLSEEFSLSSLSIDIPAERGIVATVSKNNMTGYRFFPGKVEGEGFFIAAVQKKDATDTLRASRFKSLHDKKVFDQVAHLLNGNDFVCVPASKEFFHAIAEEHEPDWQLLKSVLYLRKVGIALGTPSAKEWIPAHDLALSLDRSRSIPSIELTREDALKFLKKEDISVALQEKGWLLVTYHGLGLGWIKSLGNRYNNYLPKHWRIRMEIPTE